jgi:hypothetical protein
MKFTIPNVLHLRMIDWLLLSKQRQSARLAW